MQENIIPQPQDPIHEEITPVLSHGQYRPEIYVVQQGQGGIPNPERRTVEVIRQPQSSNIAGGADKAYQLIESFEPRPLSHGGPLWGYLFLGFILQRRSHDGFYEQPTEQTVRRVIIKRLFKQVVDTDLQHGSRENPYKEIMRMQQLAGSGNDNCNNYGFISDAYANNHVLGCIDAIIAGENDKFLYIISPYCEKESLMQHVPLQPTESQSIESQGRHIYRQMLENIHYLHHNHGICHRDVDPGVCIVFLVRVCVLLKSLHLSLVLGFRCLAFSHKLFLFLPLSLPTHT